MRRLTGRVALVTGAARGIGSAVVSRLADEGALVVATDVAGAGVDAAGTGTSDGSVMRLKLDVTSPNEWQAVVEAVRAECGGLDILVNNAGITDRDALADTSLVEWHRVVATNQTGVFLGLKSTVEPLSQSRHGSVINISSIFALSGGLGRSPAYHATKAAVWSLTKNTALSWARLGIRVNSIHPGFIDTPLIEGLRGTRFERVMLERTPMRRAGRPEEVAAGVAFLASDDASFVTGCQLYIDGGYLAR